MTTKEYLKANPQKYVLVTREFGSPIYIAPPTLESVNISDKIEGAEIWASLDNTPTKLGYYKAVTGYKGLQFEQIA